MGKGRRVEWKSCNNFEGMEVSSDNVGRLEPWKNFTNPLGFDSIILHWFSCKT
jgi:hypothetical protein